MTTTNNNKQDCVSSNKDKYFLETTQMNYNIVYVTLCNNMMSPTQIIEMMILGLLLIMILVRRITVADTIAHYGTQYRSCYAS